MATPTIPIPALPIPKIEYGYANILLPPPAPLTTVISSAVRNKNIASKFYHIPQKVKVVFAISTLTFRYGI
jgi:hypothetical protein